MNKGQKNGNVFSVHTLSFSSLQMFDWIVHNKGLFLNTYTEIGSNHQHVLELQTQHNHFAMNCMVRLFPLVQH